MNTIRATLLSTALALAAFAGAVFAPAAATAAPVSECSAIGVCFCINSDFKPLIDERVARLRAMIAAERAKGKAIGYMSVPLSTLGGGFFNINREVAERTRQAVEKRFGAASTWVLNPAMPEADIPSIGTARASGTEYMAMWTRVLEGASGMGEDFDFVYFVGPSDFAAYFGLTGVGDLDRIGAFYDARLASDPDFKRVVDAGRVTPLSFRLYYGMRASAAVSLGAHDEWNIAGKINARRRDNARLGVAQQWVMLFDGRPLSVAESELGTSGGYAGNCKP